MLRYELFEKCLEHYITVKHERANKVKEDLNKKKKEKKDNVPFKIPQARLCRVLLNFLVYQEKSSALA